MIHAGIVGCSGYVGENLLWFLNDHPEVQIGAGVSSSLAGKKVHEVYPGIASDLELTEMDLSLLSEMDIVFLAVPHGHAAEMVEDLDTKVIDMTSDHRLSHTYGLPELDPSTIASSELVANPGCYATACNLAVLPVREYIDGVVFDCISGYSGGGRNGTHDHAGNITAYKLTQHFHRKEIEMVTGKEVAFTPHVADVFSGIMCTAHVFLDHKVDPGELQKLYEDHYMGTMTKVCSNVPSTKDVVGTPFCHIGGFESFGINGIVIISVIDNLLKGAATQAVENMNLMFGLEREVGLV